VLNPSDRAYAKQDLHDPLSPTAAPLGRCRNKANIYSSGKVNRRKLLTEGFDHPAPLRQLTPQLRALIQ
jgi:hypothetical protein